MKNFAKILVGTALLSGSAVGVFEYLKSKNSDNLKKYAPDPSSQSNSFFNAILANDGSNSSKITFPIKLGSKDSVVLSIQKYIGLPSKNQTGIFDKNTVEALKKGFGITQIKDEQSLNDLLTGKLDIKDATAKDNSRLSAAINLLSLQYDYTTDNFAFQWQALVDSKEYAVINIMGDYFFTGKGITDNPNDFTAYSLYSNVTFLKLAGKGYLIAKDTNLDKLFFTNPLYWSIWNEVD
ncbi:MAG: hypothetical protein ACRDE2_00245 [Chitinophagaceae bacterium]